MLNLKNPLVVFDLETTGTNTSKDRIVEIALIKIFPDGKTEEKCRRINPGIPIPIESSLVHGIYDKDVKDEPLNPCLIFWKIVIFADLISYNLTSLYWLKNLPE